jgi:hypothetical protein
MQASYWVFFTVQSMFCNLAGGQCGMVVYLIDLENNLLTFCIRYFADLRR